MAPNPYQTTTTKVVQTQKQLRAQRLPYVVAWWMCYVSFSILFVISMFAQSSFVIMCAEYSTGALIVLCLLVSLAAPGDAWSRIAPLIGFFIAIFGHFLIAGIISAIFAMLLGELPVQS
jgi:hypothetical protein